MSAAAKSQSQDHAKKCANGAVCFRASGFKIVDREVDGIQNKIIRFYVDEGQAIEISISDVCALDLAGYLNPALNPLTKPVLSERKGEVVEEAFKLLESDPKASFSAVADHFGLKYTTLTMRLRRCNEARYQQLPQSRIRRSSNRTEQEAAE